MNLAEARARAAEDQLTLVPTVLARGTKLPDEQYAPVAPTQNQARSAPVTIERVQPAVVGNRRGSVEISVLGSGFQRGVTVTLDDPGIKVGKFYVEGPSRIVAVLEIGGEAPADGPRTLRVRNPDGGAAVLDNALTLVGYAPQKK